MQTDKNTHISDGFRLVAQSDGLLEVVCVTPCIIMTADIVAEKREEFKKTGKSSFYRQIARNRPEVLHRLGFNKTQVEDIERRGARAFRQHSNRLIQQYDIDHILSLKLGGTNTHENLCFTPIPVNRVKARMEEAQIVQFPDLDYTQTIMPTVEAKTGKRRNLIPQCILAKLQAA